MNEKKFFNSNEATQHSEDGTHFTGEEFTGEEFTGEEFTGEEFTGEEFTGEEFSGEEFTGEEFKFQRRKIMNSSFGQKIAVLLLTAAAMTVGATQTARAATGTTGGTTITNDTADRLTVDDPTTLNHAITLRDTQLTDTEMTTSWAKPVTEIVLEVTEPAADSTTITCMTVGTVDVTITETHVTGTNDTLDTSVTHSGTA